MFIISLSLITGVIYEIYSTYTSFYVNLLLSLTSFLIVVSYVYKGCIYGTHVPDTHNLQSSSSQLIHCSILASWSSYRETPFLYTATSSSSVRISSYKDSVLKTDGSLHSSLCSRYSNFSAIVD